ncbi:sensor histidine kinase [Natrinema saccharevitans]|uniref:sensor histidine kinase n=1 Tax=Natrinema saccharevitans TaxID=301967 RepID=UPI0024077876|nr:histidine kinase N-terminal 7TM domain-containing protein [Natrinema saccharevitans]
MITLLTYTSAILLLYLSALPALYSAYIVFSDRRKPAIQWFIIFMVFAAAWAFLYATMNFVTSEQLTYAIANIFWTVVPATAGAFFLFAYEFTYKQPVSNRIAFLFFVPAIILFALSWVNPGGIIYTAEYTVTDQGILQIGFPQGILFFTIVQGYGYLMTVASTSLFFAEAIHATGKRRRRAAILVIFFIGVLVATTLTIIDYFPSYYDLTSLMYGIAGVYFSHSVIQHGFIQFSPVARDQAFNMIDEAVFILNSENEVIDGNSAAATVFDVDRSAREQIEDILPMTSNTGEIKETFSRTEGRESKYYTTQTQSFVYGRGLVGKLVVAAEITKLKKREEELELVKNVLIRLFRHDIRTSMQVILGQSENLQNDLSDETATELSNIISASEDIVNKAHKIRLIDSVFGEDETVVASLPKMVEDGIEKASIPSNAVVDVSIDDTEVMCHSKFAFAVQELIENAVEHHGPDDQIRIILRTEMGNESVALFVEDNGEGIPENELDVLRREGESQLDHLSGIGLWIVKHLIEKADGVFECSNISNGGTRIRITLPYSDQHDESVSAFLDSPVSDN